jgi:hypothetical protein
VEKLVFIGGAPPLPPDPPVDPVELEVVPVLELDALVVVDDEEALCPVLELPPAAGVPVTVPPHAPALAAAVARVTTAQ